MLTTVRVISSRVARHCGNGPGSRFSERRRKWWHSRLLNRCRRTALGRGRGEAVCLQAERAATELVTVLSDLPDAELDTKVRLGCGGTTGSRGTRSSAWFFSRLLAAISRAAFGPSNAHPD